MKELEILTKEADDLFDSNNQNNMAKAIQIYQKIFQEYPNESYAPYSLGFAYERGLGTDQNLDLAKKYYELSVALNDKKAMYKLANLYLKENNSKCIDLYEQSLALGFKDAGFRLGWVFQYGRDFIKKDTEKAIFYYEQVDDDLSTIQIADILREQENYKCINLYEKVLANGNNDVLGALGIVYWEDKITFVDVPNAMEYFRKACKVENTKSIIDFINETTSYENVSAAHFKELAEMRDVCKKLIIGANINDMVKEHAKMLYDRINDHCEMINLIVTACSLLENPNEELQHKAEALNFLEKISDRYHDAPYMLAKCYGSGTSTYLGLNVTKATRLMARAAKMGNKQAGDFILTLAEQQGWV